MAVSPLLGITYYEEGQANGHITINDAWNILEFFAARAVESSGDTATPAGTNGQGYIIGTPASGQWLTDARTANDIAIFYDGWVYVTPRDGMQFYVKDTDVEELFNAGSWT